MPNPNILTVDLPEIIEPFGTSLLVPVEASLGSIACIKGVDSGAIDDDDQDAFRRMDPFESGEAPTGAELN